MAASSGPWQFFRNTYGYSITSAQGWEIARLPLHAAVASMGASYTELPARDNACMIAAAPELLEALAEAIETIETCLSAQYVSDEMRAAIAKARGLA